MKIGVVIQARMSSQRLPGKILTLIDDKPLLLYLIERLKLVGGADDLLLATSIESSDDPVAVFAAQRRIPVFRGALNNVAERFRDAALHYGYDAFARVSGDSPLLDPHLVEQALQRFRDGKADLVTNVMPRTFPKGQSVEVVRVNTFADAYLKFEQPGDFEHVTPYFYRNRDRFNILNFSADADYGDLQFSVDTQADLTHITKLVSMMKRPHWDYTLEEMVELYREAAR